MEGTVVFSKEFVKQKRSKKEKTLLVASYLKLNSPLNGNVGVSINLLAEKIGYKPDAHENKINDKIKNSITTLIDNKDVIIESRLSWDKNAKWQPRDVSLNELKANECFVIHINEDSKLFYPTEQYVMLTDSEFITIAQSCVKTDREDILNVYLNIKKFMSFGKDDKQLCYPSHATLCKDCNISSTGAMNNIISDLKNIGLVYAYNSGRYTDNNGNVKYTNNIYALDNKTLTEDVCDDIIIGYYSSQGILINKFIKDEI